MRRVGKSTRISFVLASALLAMLLEASAGPVEMPEGVPRTGKDFAVAPGDFRFVVVGDRTGGHRPGVFEAAMEQINLLHPAFVLSVGDLIEGYTEKKERIADQWSELRSMVDRLEMPFFFTVGNHDVSNASMLDYWRAELGADVYYFVYEDVLFLSLNTEDPPIELSAENRAGQARLESAMEKDPVGTQARLLEAMRERGEPVRLPGQVAIGERQVRFVEETLERYPDVRWIFVLMHKPAWLYDSPEFREIEALLEGRPYTVLAGHEHFYRWESRHGRDYIDMATTGGVWLREGGGRVDHVLLVSMTDAGPRYANIRLDGIADKAGRTDPIFQHYRDLGVHRLDKTPTLGQK